MCGISGIVDFSRKPVSTAAALRMASILAHRGPDGEGAVFFRQEGGALRFHRLDEPRVLEETRGAFAVLAHRRLAIIDLSERGSQPMSDRGGDFWIVFNGEIYNYIELRRKLTAKGYEFASDSDTEVILCAFKEWGADCLQELNGMFAFALWDVRRQELFCARDRLGIKPFYYHFAGTHFVFASEQKAIVSALARKVEPNVASMMDYLTYSYVPSSETMFRGIHRLPPGAWLRGNNSGIKIQVYWNPPFDPVVRHENDWVEELRALLDDATRLQVRSDVPVGAHLSGGIDSSAVCCLAARHVPQLLTFTAKFEEGGFFDESRYAKLVAQHIASAHHEIVPRGSDLTELIRKIIYHLDEPVEAASVFGKYHVAQIVSQSVKVVLGGQGGDELFGGYDWYIKNLFTAGLYGARLGANRGSVFPFLWQSVMRESTKRLMKSVWRNFGEASVAQVFCRNWSRFGESDLRRLFRAETQERYAIDGEQRFLHSFAALREKRDGDRMFKFDVQHYLQALLTSEDRLSMAFSVESRVPLLDHRITELAGRLGYELKTVPGRSKHILRRALEGIVPNAILQRSDKRGFPTPIAAWLQDPKLNLVNTFVFQSEFARRYFNFDYVKRLAATHSRLSSDPSERLWRIISLCVWGEVFKVS
jgi:asparagine synthase (glutamine-hydrolysing)